MLKRAEGFTLIEVTLVMALTGLMLVFIWAGQQQLRDRARFDVSVDQAVQDINYARSYARTGVAEDGPGNDPNLLSAGAGIEFDDAQTPAFPLEEMETLFDVPDAAGDFDMMTVNDWPTGEPASTCPSSQHPADLDECREVFFNLPDTGLQVTNAQHIAAYFVNIGGGELKICRDVGTVWLTLPEACATTGGPPIDIDLLDPQSGLTATIEIDAESGLATRLN